MMRSPSIDKALVQNMLGEFAKITDKSPGKDKGITRLGYTEFEKRAADYLNARFKDLRIEPKEDTAGNLFATLNGKNGRSIMTGSHIDSVKNGGRFDGIAGVVCSYAVMDALRNSDFEPWHNIISAGWRCEESASFKGFPYLGARWALGLLTPRDFTERKHEDSKETLLWHLTSGFGSEIGKKIGLEGKSDKEKVATLMQHMKNETLTAEKIRAYVEVHIEQGPVLDKLNESICAVESISGNYRFTVKFTGEGGHTGAVPQKDRKDAGMTEAEFTCKLANLVAKMNSKRDCEMYHDLRISRTNSITVGYGPTSIPAEVMVEYDVRSCDLRKLERFQYKADKLAKKIGGKRGVDIEIQPFNKEKPIEKPVLLSKDDVGAFQSDILALRTEKDAIWMPSGAGHDAKLFATHGIPTGMYFIRSIGGKSHVPEELSRIDDIVLAAEILLETVLRIDRH